MVKNDWLIKVIKQLSEIKNECNSYAAIEGARLTKTDRITIEDSITKIINYIKNKISK